MRACEPSERNFLIFCTVEFDAMPLRKVAAEHNISPTRVQQIVEQVRHWFDASTPQWVRECGPQIQPFLACRYHHERLSHYRSAMMEAWRASQGELTITHRRGGALSTTTSTTKLVHGDGRYLLQAARLSQMQIDSAVRLAKIAQKFELPEVDERPVLTIEDAANPCAPLVGEEQVAVEESVEIVVSNEEQTETYEDVADSLPAVELKNEAGATPVRSRLEKRLSRQKRRKAARQKQREHALQ